MSLFDVIRYQSVNLGSQEELTELPIELLNLYWFNAHTKHVPVSMSKQSRPKICVWLADWYKRSHECSQLARIAYKTALAGYNT